MALSSAAPGADTTRWIVSNHGRPAGDLVVVRSPDSVTTRFIYTDRNRGGRIENRYRLGSDGRPVSGESRPVRADGSAGEPTERFEILGDSAIFGATRVRREAGAWAPLSSQRLTAAVGQAEP